MTPFYESTCNGLDKIAPPSPTTETFAGLFSSEEEINYADLCSFAPTSAVMTAMDSLGDKDDDGTSINSQAEFSAEPAPPLGPLPPQDIIIPTDETIHCFPQNIIPAVERTHCFPQDFLTIQSAHTSPQDITVVGTSSVHGNSAYLRKQRKSDDGYRWIKYGEKPLRGSNNPRSYYKCNHPKCPSRKKVERDFSGNVTHVIYKGTHNHPKPPSPQRIPEYPQVELGEGSSMRDAAAAADDDEINEPTAKRLNGEGKSAAHQRRITRKPRVVIQTTSDVAVLDDGYRWRKYGEKMVKKNPNPRSYYKCTSYGCMVTKQIERAPDDLRLVLAKYEGRHNHAVPAQRIRVTYPLGRLPVMNNNTSPTAIMPSATSGHSDPTKLQTMQNQTPNANQMQQTQNVGEEHNDNSLFYFDDSFLDNLFK
ncbi:hypothetical protein CDL12_00916 [Handroanthus impetiginosus]|uniref:WRKY domain-containing protein n=1 Tax=Handroanthus impetiginosus TaxID=429701 RepID=A0A2G9I9K8_9LAMI|nr:hypothetical protein CDL12_00916 [Handroanthus impetiginosus]